MYLDPGAGSIILQVLLAGVLGIGIVARIFWKRIKSLFGKKDEAETGGEDKD
jgi:hypothetical protein